MAGAGGRLFPPSLLETGGRHQRRANQRRAELAVQREGAEDAAAEAARVAKLSDTEVSVPSAGRRVPTITQAQSLACTYFDQVCKLAQLV